MIYITMQKTLSKTLLAFVLSIFVLILSPIHVFAEENLAFQFDLTVDGEDTVNVSKGDIITVVLTLTRTDLDSPYIMYAMQDEIAYDSQFFELVPDRVLVSDGIHTTDIAKRDSYREFYMNYLSLGNGERWESQKVIGSFQLKVIADSGVTKILNNDCLVSFRDGSGSYPSEANELTVILSSSCNIRFETNGGNNMEEVLVNYGNKLSALEEPTREGYVFEGWYKDIDLTEKWDFENDVVNGNITLYAKWVEGMAAEHPTDFNIWWLLPLGAVVVVACLIILVIRKRKTNV